MECTIGIFKKQFRYFKASRSNLPLNTQVDIVYALTAIHNFINQNNLDDLESFPAVEDKEIDKGDTRLAEVESDVVINQRRDEIAKVI